MNKNQPIAMKGIILVALTMAAVMSVGVVAGSAFGAAPTGMPNAGGGVAIKLNSVANQATLLGNRISRCLGVA